MERDRPRSRQQQGEESRLAILRATLAIAAERGYDGTTLALVTERTGLPRGSIYWHFGSKDRLLAATLEYSYERWREAQPGRASPPEPIDRIGRISARFENAARVLAESPEFWSLGLMVSLRAWIEEPEALGVFRRVRADTEREMASWWAGVLGAEAAGRDPGLAQRLSRFWVVMLDGVYLQLRGTTAASLPRVFDTLASGFIRYLQVSGLVDDR